MRRVGRPIKITGGSKNVSVNMSIDRLSELEKICKEENISVSEFTRQAIDELLEKKVVGSANPLNIRFGQSYKVTKQLTLTSFMTKHNIKKIVNTLDKDTLHMAFSNSKQMLIFTHMKITGRYEEPVFK